MGWNYLLFLWKLLPFFLLLYFLPWFHATKHIVNPLSCNKATGGESAHQLGHYWVWRKALCLKAGWDRIFARPITTCRRSENLGGHHLPPHTAARWLRERWNLPTLLAALWRITDNVEDLWSCRASPFFSWNLPKARNQSFFCQTMIISNLGHQVGGQQSQILLPNR